MKNNKPNFTSNASVESLNLNTMDQQQIIQNYEQIKARPEWLDRILCLAQLAHQNPIEIKHVLILARSCIRLPHLRAVLLKDDLLAKYINALVDNKLFNCHQLMVILRDSAQHLSHSEQKAFAKSLHAHHFIRYIQHDLLEIKRSLSLEAVDVLVLFSLNQATCMQISKMPDVVTGVLQVLMNVNPDDQDQGQVFRSCVKLLALLDANNAPILISDKLDMGRLLNTCRKSFSAKPFLSLIHGAMVMRLLCSSSTKFRQLSMKSGVLPSCLRHMIAQYNQQEVALQVSLLPFLLGVVRRFSSLGDKELTHHVFDEFVRGWCADKAHRMSGEVVYDLVRSNESLATRLASNGVIQSLTDRISVSWGFLSSHDEREVQQCLYFLEKISGIKRSGLAHKLMDQRLFVALYHATAFGTPPMRSLALLVLGNVLNRIQLRAYPQNQALAKKLFMQQQQAFVSMTDKNKKVLLHLMLGLKNAGVLTVTLPDNGIGFLSECVRLLNDASFHKYHVHMVAIMADVMGEQTSHVLKNLNKSGVESLVKVLSHKEMRISGAAIELLTYAVTDPAVFDLIKRVPNMVVKLLPHLQSVVDQEALSLIARIIKDNPELGREAMQLKDRIRQMAGEQDEEVSANASDILAHLRQLRDVPSSTLDRDIENRSYVHNIFADNCRLLGKRSRQSSNDPTVLMDKHQRLCEEDSVVCSDHTL